MTAAIRPARAAVARLLRRADGCQRTVCQTPGSDGTGETPGIDDVGGASGVCGAGEVSEVSGAGGEPLAGEPLGGGEGPGGEPLLVRPKNGFFIWCFLARGRWPGLRWPRLRRLPGGPTSRGGGLGGGPGRGRRRP